MILFQSSRVVSSQVAKWADAGVVDENVDAAEFLRRLRHHGFNLVLIRDIGGNRNGFAPIAGAQILGHSARRVDVDVGNRQSGDLRFCKTLRDHRPHTGAGPVMMAA